MASFCGKDKQYTDKPQWFDPLGPDQSGVNGPTGGPEARSDIFKQLQAVTFPRAQSLASDTVTAAQSAATNPGWKAATDLATKTLHGDYLNNNPALEAQMKATRQRAGADTAGANAAIQSQFSRNGQAFSTGNQQAQQATNAAMQARLAEGETAGRLQNYQYERQAQERAPAMLESSLGTPLNYLSQLPNVENQPLTQAANVVQGLAGNGQIATPQSTIARQPGVVDYALGFTSALGSSA